MKVTIPSSLAPISILEFSRQIENLPPSECYEFDFGNRRFFPPFSMLLLSVVLKRFRDQHAESICRAQNHDKHPYAAHFGFFSSFGLQHGNAPGEARGSSTYVPITRLDVSEIKQEADNQWIEVGEVVEAHAQRLASVLVQNQLDSLHETLAYSIREIMRNTVEHSESNELFICAQFWPSKHLVEVGIADSGIGIREGLSRNPSFSGLSNREAIHMALLPGVSGNPMAGIRQETWGNSGYGLYMTNRICRNGGSFLICSGDGALSLNADQKADYPCSFSGTAVRLSISTTSLPSLRDQLSRFRDEGKKAARDIKGANRTSASLASQMLSSDFTGR